MKLKKTYVTNDIQNILQLPTTEQNIKIEYSSIELLTLLVLIRFNKLKDILISFEVLYVRLKKNYSPAYQVKKYLNFLLCA